MISTFIFLIGLSIGAYIIWQSVANIPSKDRKFPVKGTLIILGSLVLALVQPFNIERVDAGHVGIKVNLTGNSRGVSKYEYKTGWVMYNSWTEQLYEFPTFQQHIEFEDQMVITKGGFQTTIKPTFNYALKATTVGDMFQNLRLGIKEVEQGWLKTAIVGSVNDVANKWEVDKIFNERELFESAIVNECNKRVSQWFTVSQLRTNIVPPPSLQEAIEAKTKAIQQAQAEDQKALTAEAEARKKIAQAKGDSAQVVIEASAQAKAMHIKQMQLTPLYVEYMKIQKWDGKTPTTVLGNNSSTLVNVK
jgi:regulator of protease activity HflC (stomatin/prohibitin superfamily)